MPRMLADGERYLQIILPREAGCEAEIFGSLDMKCQRDVKGKPLKEDFQLVTSVFTARHSKTWKYDEGINDS